MSQLLYLLEFGMLEAVDILLDNAGWMSFNLFLAFMAVVFGIFMRRSKTRPLRLINAALWLLFVPNTIYLFTDVIHIPEQWHLVSGAEQIILLFQYLVLFVLGFITFGLSMHLFEKTFLKNRRHYKMPVMMVLNIVIGFGLVLGRIQRTNSWEAVTNIPKVLSDSLGIIQSAELLILVVLFGILCNGTYFLSRLFIKS